MKNTVVILFDCLLIILGIPLIPIGFVKWKQENFTLHTLGSMGSLEGNMGFFIMLLGIGLIWYSVFDIFTFRTNQKNDVRISRGMTESANSIPVENAIRSLEENEKNFKSTFIILTVVVGFSIILAFLINKL